MNRKSLISKRMVVFLSALMVVGILLNLLPPGTALSATQYLGGRAVTDDLRIQVLDDGRIGVERYTGSSWERQIYAVTSKGSRLQYSGGNVGIGYYTGGSKSLLYNNSSYTTSGGVKTWKAETKWNGGGFDILQTVTYREGDPYFKLQWQLTNVSGSSKSDLRFFHGEDTYLRNGDNGAGWVDWTNNTIGVKKDVGTEQRMALQGVSPTPYAYQSNSYYSVRTSVNNGALANTVDGNEWTDNGYALEWRQSSLANGSTWTIIAYEKFNNVTLGSVQVIAPVAVDCLKGSTCALVYTVKNTGSSGNINLAYTKSGSWSVSPASLSSINLSSGASQQVTLNVTVPADAANGSSMDVTLSANPSSGTGSSETAAVNAISPPNSAPTNLRLNGSTSKTFSENLASGTTLGTLSATDTDGDALTYSLVSGDTSAFSISGNLLKNSVSFNYENKSSYAITVRASDGKGGTVDQALAINVTNQNEAPTLNQPPAQTTNEDTSLNFLMAASDPDGLTGRLSWSVLTDPTLGTVSGASGTGDGKTITYTPNANANGSDSFTIRVTGEGGTTSDKTVSVTVNAVNDAPANSWNGGTAFPSSALKLRVNQVLTFDDGAAAHIPNRITVGDVDAAQVQVSLSVSHGALALSGTAGLSGDVNGVDGTLSFQSTLEAINAALDGLNYTPASGYSGNDSLTITTSDMGNAGSGGTKTDTDIVNLTIGNPNTLTVDDGFRGDSTTDWGYDRFTSIAEALAAYADYPEPKPAVTVLVNAGDYPGDSVIVDQPELTVRLAGDVHLGGDIRVSSGTFDPNGRRLTLATGSGDTTTHLLSGDIPLQDVTVETGNTLELAPGAQLSLSGVLSLNGTAGLDAIPDSGRTTLRLTGADQGLPSGLTLDNLYIAAGASFNAPAALTLQGDLANSGAFNGGYGTLTFAGPEVRTQAISGNTPQLNDVTIASGSTLQPTVNLDVSGDWDGLGLFNASSRTVNFNGTDQTISGRTVFHNVTVAGGSTLILAADSDFGFSGAFTMDGGFDPLANEGTTLRLSGDGDPVQTLPAGMDELHHLVVDSGAALSVPSALTLRGDLTNNGSFDNSGGSVTFSSGEHALHAGPAATTQLGGLTLPAGSSLTPDEDIDFSVNGDWSGEGTFNANGGKVTFNGSDQTFSGSTIFHDVAVNSSGTLTLAEGADFGYSGAFTRSGGFDPLSNANTILRLAGSAPQTLPAGADGLHHLWIQPGASLNAANRDLTLHGGLTNFGSFDNRGGSVAFSGGGAHAVTLNVEDTVLTQFGDLAIAAGNSLASSPACSAAQPLRVAGDWDKDGSFTPGACAVVFNGSGPQAILGADNGFYDLVIQNSAEFPNDDADVDTENTVNVTHVLEVLGGQFQPANGSTFVSVILGGAEEAQSGILRPDRGAALEVSGSWERRAYGWFDANAGQVRFTGVSQASLLGGTTFYNLEIAKGASGSVGSSAPVIAEKDLDVSGGSFNPSANSKFKNVTIGASGVLQPAGNINIGGNVSNGGIYTHNGKAVTFDGSGVQTLTGRMDFYNLTVNTGSILQLQAEATLGYAGAFTLQGSLDATTHPHNKVEVMGQAPLVQTLPSVTVNDLTIKDGSALKLQGALVVTGDLVAESVSAFDANGQQVTFDDTSGSQPTYDGSLTFANVHIADGVTFKLKDNADLTFTGAISRDNDGVLDGVSGGTNTTVTVAGPAGGLPDGAKLNHLMIGPGMTLNGGTANLSVAGNWTNNGTFVPGTSTVVFDGGAAQQISGAQNFNALRVDKDGDSLLSAGMVTTGGLLEVQAGQFAPACGSSFFSVAISGGELLMPDDAECQVTVNGDWTQTGGTFSHNGTQVYFDGGDGAHSISGGAASLGGLRLGAGDAVTLAGGANLTLSGPLAFDPGAGSFGGASGSTLTAAGDLDFSGELTLGNLVIEPEATETASGPVTLYGDLTNNGTYDNRLGSTTLAGTRTHTIQSGAGAETRFGGLTIPLDETLALGGDAESTERIRVAGDWLNLGTFTPNKGTVIFDGAGDQNIQSGEAANAFYNLTVDSGGVVSSLNTGEPQIPLALNVANDLVILRGQLDVPTDSVLKNVNIGREGTLALPGGGDDITVNGRWENLGEISNGDPAQDIGGSFYISSAVVDANFPIDTPGLGFDKFTTIAPALGAAADAVYIRGSAGEDPVVDYDEDLALGSETTKAAFIEGKVEVNGLSLSDAVSEVNLAGGATLTASSYAQTAGTFNTGSGAFTLNGSFAPEGGAYNLGSGELILNDSFAPAGGAFDAGTGTLKLSEDFTPAADVFNSGQSTVELNGDVPQTIAAGAQFYNLQIANSIDPIDDDGDSVLPLGAVTVANTLNVADGQFMLKDGTSLKRILIGENGILKLDSSAAVTVVEGGSLDRHENGKLYLNGGSFTGLDQTTVTVDDNWPAGTSSIGFDRFDDIPSALAANSSPLLTVKVLDGTYEPLTLDDSATIQIDGAVKFDGDLILNNGSLQIGAGKTLEISGDLTNGISNGFSTGTGTVKLSGGAAQSLSGGGLAFYDLVIDKTSGTQASTASVIDVNRNLVVSEGVFTPACGSTFTNITIEAGGELALPDGPADCAIRVSGTWHEEAGGTFTPNGGKVVFDGAEVAITGEGFSFHHLEISEEGSLTAPLNGTLTLSGDWTNNGAFVPNEGTVEFAGGAQSLGGSGALDFHSLRIGAGSTLMPAASGRTITLSGDWDQHETGQFTHNSATLVFNGAENQTVNGPVGGLDWYGLTVDKTGSKLVMNPALRLIHSLDIAQGELELHHDSEVHNTNPLTPAAAHLGASAVLTLIDEGPEDGTLLSVDSWSSDGGSLVPNGGELVIGQVSAMVVDDDFEPGVTPGYNIDRFKTISSALSKTYLTDSATITILDGTYDEPVTVNKPVRLVVSGSATIQSLTLDNTGAIFTAPDPADGKTLTLTGSLTINAGTFNANGGTLVLSGPAAKTLPENISLHNLQIAAGAAFTPPAAMTLEGDYTNLGALLAADGTALTLDGAEGTNHTFTGAARFGSLSAAADQELTLTSGAELHLLGGLTLADGPSALHAAVDSILGIVGAGPHPLPSGTTLGVLSIAEDATFEAPAVLNLTGGLINGGTFTAGTGTVTLTGSGAQSLSGEPITFNNLTIDDADDESGANHTTASAVVNVAGLLNIADGRFAPSACGQYGSVEIGPAGEFAPQTDGTCSLGVSGSWTNNGTFSAGSSKIAFNGSGPQHIGGSVDTAFAGLEIANTSEEEAVSVAEGRTLSVGGTLTVIDGTFQPSAGSSFTDVDIDEGGTFDAPAGDIQVSGNWNNSGGFNPNSGTVQFTAPGPHDTTGSTGFYNLEAADGQEIHLANGAEVNVSGALNLNTSGTISGADDSTLGLLGSGPASLPEGTILGGLVVGPELLFTAPDDLTVGGDLEIQGAFTAGEALTLGGGFELAASGSFDPNGGTVTFSGAGPHILAGAPTFNDLVVDDTTLNLAEDSTLTIAGDLTTAGAGTIDGEAAGATLAFTGGGTRTLPDGLSLRNLAAGEGTTLVVPGSLSLMGDLTVDGMLDNTGGSITFGGLEETSQRILGSGPVILGTVIIDEGTTLTPDDGRTIAVTGDWTNNGDFAPNNGRVIFNGSGAQAIQGSADTNFADLEIDNASGQPVSVTAPRTLNVQGELALTEGIFQPTAGSSLHDVTIGGSGTLAAPAGELYVSGDWADAHAGGGLAGDGGTVVFNGDGAQTFSGASNFEDLRIGPASTLVLGSEASLGYTGAFDIDDGGSLDATSNPDTMLRVAGDGDPFQTLPDGLTLNDLAVAENAVLDGAETGLTLLGGLDASGDITNGLSVTFSGEAEHPLTGTGALHLGDVTIGAGSTVVPSAGRQVFVGGDWTDNSGNTGGGFTAGTSQVTFEGAGEHALGGDSLTHFNDLAISAGTVSGPAASSGTLTVADGATFQPAGGSSFHHVTNSGTLGPEAYGTISVSGDWANNGVFEPNDGTVVLDGSEDQSISDANPPAAFNNLVIRGAGTVTPAAPLAVSGDLRLEEEGGTLVVPDGSSFSNVQIGSGATFSLSPEGEFTLNGTWSNQGTYDANGGGMAADSSPSIDTVYVDPNGCALTPAACGVERFATIQEAINAVARDGGVNILPSIDPYGTPGETSVDMPEDKPVRLVFEGGSDATFTISGDIIQHSGTIIAPAGTLRLTGSYAHTGGTFDANSGAVVLAGSGTQVLSGEALTFQDLTVDDADDVSGANLVNGQAVIAVNGALNIADGVFSPAQCGSYGNLVIGLQGTLAPQNTAACVNVGGDWTNDGAFSDPGVTVTLNGSGAQVLGGADPQRFTHLKIENTSGESAVTLAEAVRVDVSGDLTLADGRFEPSEGSSFEHIFITEHGTLAPEAGITIHVSGDISSGGAFLANNGTVVLDGGADGQSLTGELSFHNLTLELDPASSIVDAGPGLRVENNLVVTSGELQFADGAIFNHIHIGADGTLAPEADAGFSVSGNWNNTGTFEHGTSTVTFNGSDAQSVSGVDTFYNIVTANSAEPEPACTTQAECNAFYDAHDVGFDRPVTVLNDLVVNAGQIQPQAGSVLNNLTIGRDGRLRGGPDSDGDPDNDTLTVGGRITNQGLLDLNGLAARGDFALSQVYVASGFTEAGTPGFGVDHFTSLQEALVVPGASSDTIFTVYGGSYAGPVDVTQPLRIDLEAVSILTGSPQAIQIDGALTIDHSSAAVSLLSGELRLSGDLNLAAGSFDAGAGQVTFAGSGPQSIQGDLSFYDLKILNTASPADDENDVQAAAAIIVAHELRVAEGQFSPQPCSTFGSVVIESGGILKPQAASASCSSGLAVQGDWTNSGGSFNPNGALVTFDGMTPQVITGETGFGDLAFDNDAGVSAAAPFTSGGRLEILDGTLTLPDGAQVHDLVIGSGGRLALEADTTEPIEPGTLIVTGDWEDNRNGGGFTANDGTVRFDGDGDQTYTGATTFHNLVAGPASTLILGEDADLGFSGDLEIEPGGGLDATRSPNTTLTLAHTESSSEPRTLPGDSLTLNHLAIDSGASLDGGSQNLTLLGDFTNNGTFSGGTGTVTFAGPDGRTQHISGDGDTIFNNLNLVQDVTGEAPVSATGLVDVQSGTFMPADGSAFSDVLIGPGGTLDGSAGTLHVTGDWDNQGTFAPGDGTDQVIFDGPANQEIRGETDFNNLQINKTGPDATVTVLDRLNVAGDLEVDEGRFVQVRSGSVFNNITVTEGGRLVAEENATDIRANSYSFVPGGFESPGGVFRPSNILWEDGSTQVEIPEKPADLLVGQLKSVDLNQDPQTAFSYALTDDGGCGPDNGFFTLKVSEGRASLYTLKPLDYETRTTYTVCVQTTDPGGLSLAKAFQVTALDANDEPVIAQDAADAQADSRLTVTMDEDGAPKAFALSLTASDQDRGPGGGQRDSLTWSIVADGSHGHASLAGSPAGNSLALQYASSQPDWNGQDQFTVAVSDGTTATDLVVKVQVRPRNDPPNNVQPPAILTGGQARIGEAVRATSGEWNDNNDPEQPGSISVTYQWQRANNPAEDGLVDIAGATGSAYIPTAADQGRYIRVMVTAHDTGSGTPAAASAQQASGWVQVPGFAPVDLALSHRMIAEKQPAGTLVGTLSALDSDQGDNFTYELAAGEGDADNGAFAIQGDRLLTSRVFDFSERVDYTIRVRATDGGGNNVESVFALQVVGTRAEVVPKESSLFEYPGTAAAPGTTTVDVPVGSVLDPITLVYIPQQAIPAILENQVFLNYAFDLIATHNGEELKDYEFNKAITITLLYSDPVQNLARAQGAGSSPINVDKNSLALMRWNGNAWENAACGETQSLPEENKLLVPLCKPGKLAVFGEPRFSILMPLIFQQGTP